MRSVSPTVLPAALALLAILTFAPSIGNGFTNWDDEAYVVANQLIRSLDANGLRSIFHPSSVVVGNWAPITILSYAIDYSLWDLRPGGFHLTNVLLHGVCTALLYALLVRVFGRGDPRRGRRAAAIGAALFAIHPVQVESVAWVAERKNLLGMSLMLGAFLAWFRFSRVGFGSRWYLLFLLLFHLALLSKAQAVILPPLIVLFEWIERRQWKAPVKDLRVRILLLLPAFLGALGVGWKTFEAQGTADQARFTGDILGSFATAPVLVLEYVADLLLPMNRSPILRRTLFENPWSPIPSAAWIALLGLTLAALWRRRQSPHVAFFWFWFLGALAPVLNFVPLPVLAADRYQYWAAPAIFALAGIGLDRWLLQATPRRRIFGAGVAGAGAGLLLIHTLTWIPVWRDSISLWTVANRNQPGNVIVHTNLGAALVAAGRSEEAIPHLLVGINKRPDDGRLRLNLGVAYLKLGRIPDAVAHARIAVKLNARSLKAWLLLGTVLEQAGQLSEAAHAFEQALRLDPQQPAALEHLRALRVDEAGRVPGAAAASPGGGDETPSVRR